MAVCWECAFTAHKACPTVLKLDMAAMARRQEVNHIRAQLTSLRDTFTKQLQLLDIAGHTMAANSRETKAELEAFFDQVFALLSEKREQLRRCASEDCDKECSNITKRREACTAMLEEIEETSVVADMLAMEAGQDDVLVEFAPLKQQYDNLLYIHPAVAEPHVSA